MASTKNAGVKLPRALRKGSQGRTRASSVAKGASIPKPNPSYFQMPVETLRANGEVIKALRIMAREDGLVSTALFNMVQVAMSGYVLSAFNATTGLHDPSATVTANRVLASWGTLFDYTKGYSDKPTTEEIIVSALKEAATCGRVFGELVLDSNFLPTRVQLYPGEEVEWRSRGDGTRYPRQRPSSGGEAVDMDYPTVWVHDLHPEVGQDYPTPLLQAALNSSFYFNEFVEDMRRVVRRAGHGRLVVKLNWNAIKATADEETQASPEKLQSYMEQVREEVEDNLKGLEPEDAIVTYDSAEFDTKATGGDKADYTGLLQAIEGVLATSLKSNPSAIGLRMNGSQSLSNTESLIYLKVAESLHTPVEAFMSRALTLACRLYGHDVFVEFAFKKINLRPDDELEAHRLIKQQRILEQLSLGLISDDKARQDLDLPPWQEGDVLLSGTRFMDNAGTKGQDFIDKVSPNNGPQERALTPGNKKAGGKSQ